MLQVQAKIRMNVQWSSHRQRGSEREGVSERVRENENYECVPLAFKGFELFIRFRWCAEIKLLYSFRHYLICIGQSQESSRKSKKMFRRNCKLYIMAIIYRLSRHIEDFPRCGQCYLSYEKWETKVHIDVT